MTVTMSAGRSRRLLPNVGWPFLLCGLRRRPTCFPLRLENEAGGAEHCKGRPQNQRFAAAFAMPAGLRAVGVFGKAPPVIS
jgi:hypothetical protein